MAQAPMSSPALNPDSDSVRRDHAAGSAPYSAARRGSLTQRADHLQALIRAIPDLICLKGVEGTYISCNTAFERYLGATESGIVGRTDLDFFDRELTDFFRAQDQAALAADGPTVTEDWLTFADDGYRGLFQTIKTPMRDASGALFGILSVARDITAVKEAESRLLASELRYRRLFESAKDGILILDAETGTVDDVNPYLIRRLGFTREQFLGKAIWELGFFRDIVASKASFEELQANEYVRYEDKPLETADGRRFDVEFISNVYLVNGERVIQCNIRDISVRKAAERQLREQNEILSHSHEAVMIVSLANKVLLWNPAAARLFGWTDAEALGRTPEELLGLDDPAVVADYRTLVERDGFWNGELRAKSRDGRKLSVDCRITLVRDDEGRPRARLNSLVDVSEKRVLEEKFLRVQRLEAIGTLSGGIAHDLNNILAPILMSAGVLRPRMVDPEDQELMALIENSVRRGADIIRQLLTFSRGIEGERTVVQVRHLIKEMAGIVRETFPRNIALADTADAELWSVLGDATQLHQVLMNLCVNARDAMRAGGTLTVTAKNVRLSQHETVLGANALDGPYVLLTVRDTGHGIPHEIIERIFEPFYTAKPLGEGTGLGLSTVLGIVRSHGGYVTAYSEPGHGSAFHVYLPAVLDNSSAIAATEREELADGGGETVLVVDDESSIVTAVRHCLETHGYRVLTAGDGEEALSVFQAHRPQVRVVVTDMMMPVMDGMTLATSIRRLDANVRVIASSGLGHRDAAGGEDAGVIAEHLDKPIDPATLLAAIRRQLKHANAG